MVPLKSDTKIIRVSIHDSSKNGGLTKQKTKRFPFIHINQNKKMIFKKKNSIIPINEQISQDNQSLDPPSIHRESEKISINSSKTQLFSKYDFDTLTRLNTIRYKDERNNKRNRRRRCGICYMTSCCCCYVIIASILFVLFAAIAAAIILLSTETTITTVTTVVLTCNTCNGLCWNQTSSILAGTSSKSLSDPRGINFDSNDTMYLSAHSLGYIQKSIFDYTNRTAATTNYGDHIDYMIFDKNGYMYANDHNDNLVRRYPPNSPNATIIAGTNSNVTGTLKNPLGLAIDDNLTLYICDSELEKIYKLEQNSSTLVQVIDTSSVTKTPSAILLSQNSTDEIYISDEGGNAVYLWKFGLTTPSIIYTDVENGIKLNGPRGIKLDQDGNLYVADKNNYRIIMFCSNSTNGTIIAQVPSPPADIAFDSFMNLYTIGSTSGKVYKFNLY